MKYDQQPSFQCAKSIDTGVFVEVGTWEGDFSYELLKHTNCKQLYCVDPYKHFEDSSYPDGMNSLTQAEFDSKYNTVRNRFSEFGNRVEFLRSNSSDAAKSFEDGSVDFAYIDGNHEYKAVLDDILAWYPKVKNGGYLCGDDICSTDMKEHDSEGNVLRIWARKSDGSPLYWGKYGTYAALLKAKEILRFDYTINNSQFIIKKSS
jgi:hypothetical protein